MKSGHIHSLLKALNIHNTSDREKWVNCSCPFAKWTHKGGHDNNPSFGIRINSIGVSLFKCWSCGKKGDIATLLMRLQHFESVTPHNQPYNWKKAWEIAELETDTADIFEFEEADYEAVTSGGLVEFPESWLQSFINGVGHPYLQARNIPAWVAEHFNVRYDIVENRVCVPIRDYAGILYGMQGRSTKKNPTLPYKFYLYQSKSNNSMWMGEHQVDPNQPVVLVEGMFDMFSVARVYTNVIASLTSSLGDSKLDRLKECDRVIGFYDYGTGGDFARDKLKHYFKKTKRLLGNCIPTASEDDPGAMNSVRIAEELLRVAPGIILNKSDI